VSYFIFVNEVAKLNQTIQAIGSYCKANVIFGNMKRLLLFLFISGLLGTKANAQFETMRDSVVQLYGIVMTADSLVGIPAVNITIKGQNRGTMTNNQGVFSIVVLKGDVVEFTHVSYKPKQVTIPVDIKSSQQSIVQLMVEDTVYLPATIIRPRPTPQQFERDFVNTKVPDDDIEIARQNNNAAKRRALMESTPGDAGGATALQMRQAAQQATYRGQIPPMNIFNPAAWSEFIQSWKRGDYKRKK
jgi:hypothetical protein